MKHPISCALALAIGTALAGCATTVPATNTTSEASMPATYNGPFAAPSALDLHYPQFDAIQDGDFAPAFDAGMAAQLREMEAIAGNPEPATFQNTIVALEKSGQVLDRATNVFFNLIGTDKNDVREKLESEYAPKFSAHRDAIALNPKLFARIKTLHDNRASLGLDAIDLRLLEKRYTDFVRSGAALSDAQKARIREINTDLSKLGTQFNQNVLAEVNDSAVVVDSREQLRIERDRVAVGRELRRVFRFQLLADIVLVGADQVEEHVGRAIQHLAAFFHRDDGVLEGRRLRVAGDRIHLPQLLGHAGVEGRREIGVLDRVELRVVEVELTGGGERAAVRIGGHRGFRGNGRRRGGGAAGQRGGDGERKRAADWMLHSNLVGRVGDRKA